MQEKFIKLKTDALLRYATDERNNGQIDNAVNAYIELYKRYMEVKDKVNAAAVKHQEGVSYKEGIQKENGFKDPYYIAAVNCYDQAEALYKELKLIGDVGKVLRDRAIAMSLYADHIPDSFSIFEKSIVYTMEDNLLAETAITHSKYAVALALHADYDLADSHIEEARLLYQKDQTNWFYIGTTYIDSSRVLTLEGKLDEAIFELLEAEKIFKTKVVGSMERRFAQLYLKLRNLYKEKGNNAKMEEYEIAYQEKAQALSPIARKVINLEA